jgi:hypothetical protein
MENRNKIYRAERAWAATRCFFVLTAAICCAAATDSYAAKRNAVSPDGKNAVNGGFGLQVGMSYDWAPGGFKWFNEYNRELSEHVWLNTQINLTLGNSRSHCWYDNQGNYHCDERYNDYRWGGRSLEFAVGPKLRFPLDKIPLVIDAKLDGFLDVLFFGDGYTGVSTGFRGGVGVHYFIFDNLGIGAEIMCNLGPYFMEGYVGFYATLDFQILGVEFRF